MKKLMTMIAAVATAFGLYAAAPLPSDTGTSFEGDSAGTLAEKAGDIYGLPDASGAYTTKEGAGYWDLGTLTDEASISELGTLYPAYDIERAPQYGTESQNFYCLALATSSNTVTRYAVAKDNDTVVPVEVVSNLFFDAVVNLTAFDEDQTTNVVGSKIAVWLWDHSEEETPGATNLMVTVGGESYVCGEASALVDTWKRVTIKAMKISSTQLGFVVFVGEDADEMSALVYAGEKMDYADDISDAAKVWADDKKLFPVAGTTIESVGFRGKGAVDDIVFTETLPFTAAKDTEFQTIRWDANAVTAISVNGTPVDKGAGYYLAPITAGQPIEVVWTGTDGYINGNKTISSPSEKTAINLMDEDILEAKAVTIADDVTTKYATVALAIDNGDGKTVQLRADADAIAFNANATITLDLNGFDVKAPAAATEEAGVPAINVTAGAVTITNSSVTAAQVIGSPITIEEVPTHLPATQIARDDSTEEALVALTIQAGEFIGFVDATVITDGKFSYAENADGDDCLIPANIGDKVWANDGAWWYPTEAAKKGTVIFICKKNDVEYGRVTNDTCDVGTVINKVDFPTFDLDTDVWTLTWGQDSVTVAETETEVTAVAAIEFTGEGTEASPYQIASAVDFKKVQAAVADGENFAEKFFVLANNVDMSGIAWEGIGQWDGGSGDKDIDFRGTLNGAGYTIQNITFARGEYYGFFNQLENATISNITFNVAGFAEGTETSYGAGVVGNWVKGSTFDHVTVTGTLTGTHNVAGFVLKACGGTTFTDCVNNATVTCTGTKRSSGFVAFESSISGGITFVRCVNNGDLSVKYIDSNDYSVGGFIGGMSGGNDIVFEDCVNNGTITSTDYTSGLIRKGAFIGVCQPSSTGAKTNTVTATGCSMKVFDGLRAVGGFAPQTGSDVGKTDLAITVSGLNYATIAGDPAVATFVADDALALGGSYKVMVPGAAPVFEFAAAGTIAFNTNLCEVANFDGITGGDAFNVTPAEAAGTVTFTAALKTFTVTFYNDTVFATSNNIPYGTTTAAPVPAPEKSGFAFQYWATISGDQTNQFSFATAITQNYDLYAIFEAQAPVTPVIDPTQPSDPMSAEAAEAAAKAINENKAAYIKAPDAFGELAPAALTTYQSYFTAVVTGSGDNSKVELQLNADGQKALQDSVNDDVVKIKPAEIAAGTADDVTIDAIPGFYYGVKAGNGIGTMAIKSSVPATSGKLTLDLPSFTGSGFYTIVASPTPMTVVGD